MPSGTTPEEYSQQDKADLTLTRLFGVIPEGEQWRLAGSLNKQVRRDLALRKDLLPKIQIELAKDKERAVRSYLARNPNLLPELQLPLATDLDADVQMSIAYREDLLPEAQPLVAACRDWGVRSHLASRADLLPELQVLLASDSEMQVVASLLKAHVSLPSEVQLVVIATQDNNPNIMNTMALGSDLSQAAQIALATSHSASVKCGLAQNPNITETTKLILAADVEYNNGVVERLERRDDLSAAVIVALARHPDKVIRIRIAQNNWKHPARRVAPEVIAELALDFDVEVRLAAVSHNTFEPYSDIAVKIANDRSSRVREAAREASKLT